MFFKRKKIEEPVMKEEEPKKYRDSKGEFDGYINSIHAGGKVYRLQCQIEEVHPIVCKNCGAPLKLEFGQGTCAHCGTHYAVNYFIEEVK